MGIAEQIRKCIAAEIGAQSTSLLDPYIDRIVARAVEVITPAVTEAVTATIRKEIQEEMAAMFTEQAA
jgi:hypothetical protein